jgi:hypothetical protein
MALIATCHCKSTRIELPDLPTSMKECNCTFCGRVGAVWGYYRPGEIRVLSAEQDEVYSASEGLNLHHFCRRCGCNTHGDSPDWASAYNADGTPKEGDGSVIPTQRILGVNMRMVDDLDLTRLPIEKVDGRNSW